ncbi:hypothetical protein [Anaerobiospirillum sp. NML120449]|uniref:hypothetical protein n=1 Tax=Anaerobiospirillum sp. NML120449 TaxID=2932817 RepID=UPI001FF11E14|nr:hypothetical protein [Anaerobiospirillum sp. NML120449]MCK0526805.1 hypothetical protein [Anaerobiospirillum sp. NML120449]
MDRFSLDRAFAQEQLTVVRSFRRGAAWAGFSMWHGSLLREENSLESSLENALFL